MIYNQCAFYYNQTCQCVKMADDIIPLNTGPISLDLGGGDFKDKLSETIQNLDLKSVMEKMVGTLPDGETTEAQESIKKMLEKFEAMSEDEKADFTAKIKEGLKQKLMNFNIGDHIDMSGVQQAISDAIAYKLQIAAIVVGVIAILFFTLLVFCGYKLYKSIKSKEIKREEKKKAKELKKKK